MRKIEKKMIEFLDWKLMSNGLAQHAIATKDARTLYRLAMQACVGIREKSGNNDGPMVELMQETIGGHSNEAWCMSAQQTGIAYAEFKTGIISPIYASEHCLTVWKNTPEEQRVKRFPLAGAIIIWQHGVSSSGHAGCLESTDGDIMFSYEGNTTQGLDENGDVEREGGGFYYCKRGFAGNGEMKVVGFLKPF